MLSPPIQDPDRSGSEYSNYGARVRFCHEMLDLIGEDEHLANNIWMSDEAHFHVSGFVNKQNFRYWSQANPPALHKKPLHSQKVMKQDEATSHTA